MSPVAADRDEGGSAVVLATVGTLVLLLVAVVVVDLAAIARGYATATAAADGAALGAVAATSPFDPADPTAVAASLAFEGGTTLVRCDCAGPVVEVEVLRTVRTITLHRLGIEHLYVTASATLMEADSVPDAGR